MTLGANLSLRITAILLGGFVLLQVLVFAFTSPGGRADDLYGLPRPATVAVMARELEQAPAPERAVLLEAFNGSLYSATLAGAFPPDGAQGAARDALAARYGAQLQGRRVRVGGRVPVLRSLGRSLWPGRILAPLTLAVGLKDGGVLVFTSRPSGPVQGFLNRRAFLGLVGGIAVLLALALAVRQTTGPLQRLARDIRAFAGRPDAPALPVEGSREMRDLAEAYNEMKDRIAGLIAERTRVLAAVAHDMRTYLTRLRLRAEFIEDESQRVRAVADLAEMSALLDDTLLFAQDETQPPPLETLDLAAELMAIVEARREIGEAVSLTGPGSAIRIRANRLSLRRMLANLIDNGLRHGGAVEVAVTADAAGAAVDVCDDGPGVPPEALARLGRPFQRLDISRDRATGGAGLGLAIVRALAARQGASVSFANRAPRGFVARILFTAAG